MKKLALISGLLFFIVYFWATNIMSNDNILTEVYPATARNAGTEVIPANGSVAEKIMNSEAPGSVNKNYYLIIASVSSIEQARLTAAWYKKEYHADILILPPTPEGYYRISYGKYSTQEEAGTTMRHLKEKVTSGVWLLSSK